MNVFKKYQIELCLKHGRECDFNVIYTWISGTLSQAKVDMLQASNDVARKVETQGKAAINTITWKQVDAAIDAVLV